jgi:hypothetical protein
MVKKTTNSDKHQRWGNRLWLHFFYEKCNTIFFVLNKRNNKLLKTLSYKKKNIEKLSHTKWIEWVLKPNHNITSNVL